MSDMEAAARNQDPAQALPQADRAGLPAQDRARDTDLLASIAARIAAVEDLLVAARDQGSVSQPPRTPAARPKAGPVDADRLKAQLREARSAAADAHAFADAAQRAFEMRHGELKRQELGLQRDAEAARSEVERLAAIVGRFQAEEAEAEAERHRAQQYIGHVLRNEHAMLSPAPGMRDLVRLGRVRRWRRQARDYSGLVSRIEQATAAIEAAQQRCAEVRELRRQAESLANAAEPRASQLESAAAVLRGELANIEEILAGLPDYRSGDASLSPDYTRWVELYDTLRDGDRRSIRARAVRFAYRPLISIIVPVYNTPHVFLEEAVASVEAQLYENWELCLVDDASSDPAIAGMLAMFAKRDPRIKVTRHETNRHIAAASNSALALASGEFLALLDHDDLLAEQALFEVVACLNRHPDLDLIYSDEDHIDEKGVRHTPYFKTDYNPELMLGHNLVNHLGVYRRSLVERLGGFKLGYEGSQDYDLALRVIDASTRARVHHIPSVLYHWRSNSGEATFSEAYLQRCLTAARSAIADHLVRVGQAGSVGPHPSIPTWQRVTRALPDPAPLVTVIVPTKNGADILAPCMSGLLERTAYPNLEVIVVDHESTDPDTLRLLDQYARDERVRILPYRGAFNYSAINNAAVREAKGSVLALLNNDVDVVNADWLDEMVALALLPDVGAVGAKLLYPDGRVQHAGVALGTGGVAGHLFHLLGRDDPGYFGRAALTSSVSAVTAACLVVRTAVFDEVKGFDAIHLPVAFNDIDLCMKIAERGYRNVWTPHALLYHHESVSRGSDETPERALRFQREAEFMKAKWGDTLRNDPFYNPNLNLDAANFTLAFPPRRERSWHDLGPV